MKNSLVNRFRILLLIPLVVVLVLSGILWMFNLREFNAYDKDISLLMEKRNELRLLQHNFEGEVSNLRGYLAVRRDVFLTNLYDRQSQTVKYSTQFSDLTLTGQERQFIQDIQKDVTLFNIKHVPAGIALAKSANYKELARMSSDDGVTDFINSIQTRLENQMEKYTLQVNTIQLEHKNYILYSLGSFLIVLLGMLFLSYWTITRFAREIGTPLETLTLAARRLSNGEFTPVPSMNRQDELGELEKAFNRMIKTLEGKETDLLVQNQELTAHQEELYAQQLELEETVEKLTDKENSLLRRNQLSTSLATEIEVRSMLASTLDSMTNISHSQIGAIIMLDDEIEEKYVCKGLSQQQAENILNHIDSGMTGRAIHEKSVLYLDRTARTEEHEHHEVYTVHDLYLPLLDREDRVIALLILTRLSGLRFTPAEMEECKALAKQISLAVENAVSYSKIKRTNLINHAILNSALEGVALISPEGKIVAVNQAWCDLYGLDKPEDIARDDLRSVIRKNMKHPDEVYSFYSHVLTGNVSENEELTFEMIRPFYHVIKMYHRRVISEAGETLGWVIVSRDITREYEIDRMKSEFVSTVSHELRTPLSSILGFVEIMLQRKINPDKQTRYLNTIYKEARRLTNLINDFLDVQRMESGKQEYVKEFLPLHKVVDESVQMQQTSLHDIVFEQRTNEDIIYADYDKMQQVITNLLSNAIKYSPAGGKIHVVIDSCSSRPQDVCLHITDEGLGIPEEALPHLFDKFYRVDNSDRRKIGGTGLGLSVCAEIVKAHDGLIRVESALGKGSTFTVSIPIVHSSSDLTDSRNDNSLFSTSTLSSPNQEKSPIGHILIVEDDESLRTYLSEELGNTLTRNGLLIKHATDGETALQSIRNETPLLIILDIMLGAGKDGWEVLKEVKSESSLRHIPVVISSALEEKEKGYGYGVAEYLIKPYPAEKLTSIVSNLLESADQEGHVFIPKEQGNGNRNE